MHLNDSTHFSAASLLGASNFSPSVICLWDVKLVLVVHHPLYSTASIVKRAILKFTVLPTIKHNIMFWTVFIKFHVDSYTTLAAFISDY